MKFDVDPIKPKKNKQGYIPNEILEDVPTKPIKPDKSLTPPKKPKKQRSHIMDTNWNLIIIALIIVGLIMLSIYLGLNYMSEEEKIELCPDLSCPEISIPACPTSPACPSCPACPSSTCTLETASGSLTDINKTCMGFNQIVDLILVYNTTYNTTIRSNYTGDYYEILPPNETEEGASKILIRIGG